ncbi:alpha-ketoglutarate-dependent dioxygenase AlkB family protein [Pseudoalteromonas fenneropenaei]|uniref:Alpha-ketoglutarate-dependent dioxygenase AlkB family protein n=1 Tax=Pseudoalteromonas fenneropenaei TaxID=1737459 RepID=A0ABV7CLE4_9GAMM
MFESLQKPQLPSGFSYYPQVLSMDKALALYQYLQTAMPWQQPQIQVYGRKHPIPRLQCYVADAGLNYAYSQMTLTPLPWSEPLRAMRARLEHHYQRPFNALLLNYYRDGRDCMGWHSDDEQELGHQPVIASISLGAPRKFTIKHKFNDEKHQLMLEHGSCLVMHGDSQHHYQHALPKQLKVQGGRINLTFRYIIGPKE